MHFVPILLRNFGVSRSCVEAILSVLGVKIKTAVFLCIMKKTGCLAGFKITSRETSQNTAPREHKHFIRSMRDVRTEDIRRNHGYIRDFLCSSCFCCRQHYALSLQCARKVK